MTSSVEFGLKVKIDGDRVVVEGVKDIQGAFGKMREEVNRTSQDLDQAAQTNRRTADSLLNLNKMAKAVGVGLAAIGAGKLVTDLYQVNASTQQFKASLEVATGSIQGANQAWTTLEQFASSTPYALTQSVQAFITMSNLGLVPTEERLKSFGNTASAMGKDLMQMIEAVADASTGEFERLKEFGIKAKTEGDKIRFIFRGIETEVKNSSDAIVNYLEGIGGTTFAGQMELQMSTLGGAMSNLEDNVDGLMRAFGERGANDGLAGAISWVSEMVSGLTEQLKGETSDSITEEIARLEALEDALGGKKRRNNTQDGIARRLADLREELVLVKALEGDTNAIIEIIAQLNDQLDGVTENTGRGRNAAGKNNRVKDLKEQLGLMNAALIDSILVITDERKALDTNTESTKDNEKAAEKLRREKERQKERFEDAIDSLRFETEWLQRELVALQLGGNALVQFNREKFIETELRKLNVQTGSAEETLLRREAAARFDATQAIADYNDELDATNEKIKENQKAQEEAARAAADAAQEHQRIQEQFIGEIAGAFFSNFDNIGDAFDDLVDRMERELLNSTLSQVFGLQSTNTPILSGLGQMLGGGGSASGSSSGLDLDSLLSLKNLTGGVNTLITGLGQAINLLPASITQGLVESGASIVSDAAFEQAVLEGGLKQGWNLNAGYGALATAGAGIAGGYVGNVVGEGISGKTAESNYGATGGAVIGSYIAAGTQVGGVWGAAIGAFIGALVDVFGGGDGKERVALGISTDPDRKVGDHIATQIDAASGLSITSYDKRVGDDGRDLAQTLAAAAAYSDAVLVNLYKSQGKDVTGVLKGQRLDGKSSEYGADLNPSFFGSAQYNELNAEDLESLVDDFIGAWQAKVQELTGEIVDLSPFEPLIREGEALIDTIVRASGEFAVVDQVLQALGVSTYEFNTAGIAAASTLVEHAGGIHALAAASDYYYQNVYSEEERAQKIYDEHAQTIGEFNETFGTAITNTDQLRAYVDSLANSQTFATEATQEAWLAAIQLTPALVGQSEAMKTLGLAVGEMSGATQDQLASWGDSITDTFERYLGRPPKTEGLDYWISVVASGNATLEQVLQYIAESSEALGYHQQRMAEAGSWLDQILFDALDPKTQATFKEDDRYQSQLDTIQRYIDDGLLTAEEAAAGMAAIEQRHAEILTDITNRYAEAGEAISQIANALAAETARLEIDLLRSQGDSTGADAAQRAIDTAGMSDAEIAIHDYNTALRALINTNNAAAQAAQTEAARIEQSMAAFADNSQRLQAQLLELQGDSAGAQAMLEQLATAGLTQVEIEAYQANQALQAQIETEIGLADAAREVAAEAERIGQSLANFGNEGQQLRAEFLQLSGDAAGAQAILDQLATAGLSPLEIEAYNANQALRASITGLQSLQAAEQALAEDRQRVADEHYSLETQLLQAMGAEDELRRRHLETIDPSNRYIQEQIWAIEDAAEATDTLTNSTSQLRSAADSLRSTIASLSLGSNTYLTNKEQLDFARSEFAAAKQAFDKTGDSSALDGTAKALAQELAEYYAGSETGRVEFDAMLQYLTSAGVSLDAQADATDRAESIALAQQTSLENLVGLFSAFPTTVADLMSDNYLDAIALGDRLERANPATFIPVTQGEIIIDPASADVSRRAGAATQVITSPELLAKIDVLIARVESLERTNGTGFVRAEDQREREIAAIEESADEIARKLNPVSLSGGV